MTAPEISATNPLPSAAKPPEEQRRGSPPPSTYAFRLFTPRAGEEQLTTAQRPALDYADTPPDELKESRKRELADMLLVRLPGLQLYQFPYHQIAAFERISIEQARSRHRHLELNSPEGGHGIQIMLRDEDATLTIPFWHETAKAVEAFREVWTCLETLCSQAGYLAYDSQLGRLVDLAKDTEEALACYIGTLCRLREGHSNGVTGEKAKAHEPGICELIKPEGCGVVLVATSDGGTACGFAEISIALKRANGSMANGLAAMTGWYVEPSFRGRGIDLRLLESAKAWAASRGLGELSGLPAVDNEAPAANEPLPEIACATVATR